LIDIHAADVYARGQHRLNADDKFLLELVRETKGGVDLDLLQFPHEKRKIYAPQRSLKPWASITGLSQMRQ
jgi:hypothetical protein